ncbi:hypothetical protein CC80DRAFT_444484 [Byssothecium circinans]|uniref:50S ribosomal protein-like protein YmL27 n=1 Tax=Byssothecium circinans TaxID=147558 RepID=A0A6A5TZK8_9PLEO|nr:hypothetical protein CC80DRAFT_444484 [Byssothecium circinans]
MFKPTPTLQKMLRRLPLSTKQAGKEYYKGNRIGSMGIIDKYGRFHPDFSKIRTFVYPGGRMKGFDLTPFVSSSAPRNVQISETLYKVPLKTITGEQYLTEWKEQGGHDQVEVPMGQDGADEPRKNMPEVWEESGQKA